MTVDVREADAQDLPTIVAIYNQVVATSAAIWRDEPASLDDRRAWFEGIRAQGYPVLVATQDDGQVVGFASLTAFRDFPGYHPTVEHSIHVAEAERGAGVGQALLDALIDRAQALGKLVMIAGLDAGNAGSLRFHQRAGFREVGRLPGIGRKLGQPVDLVLLQRDLPPVPASTAGDASTAHEVPDTEATDRSAP
ncbi:MAG: family acetyltransferase [Acidimicrobiales bacterium]|nr:family acetyltransferase [Acidimicrobiales bacterium]